MWSTTTLGNSAKLFQDKQNSRNEGYISKFVKKVKMQSLPLITSGTNFLQSRFASSAFGLDIISNLTEFEKHLPVVESEMSFDKVNELSFGQRFSNRSPYQIPGNVAYKVPPIIGGFIGTKSQSSREENQLDALIMNLLNKCIGLNENMASRNHIVKSTGSIADEVEKYFSQNKDSCKVPTTKVSSMSTEMVRNDENETQLFVEPIKTKPLAAEKPICAVLPIVKPMTKISAYPMEATDCISETDEILKGAASVGKMACVMKDTISMKQKIQQLCSICQQPSPGNKKSKKTNFSAICSCLEKECSIVSAQNNEQSPKPKSSKARKNRKTKQRRKNKIKQCREQQIIGLVQFDKGSHVDNTGTRDELDSTNGLIDQFQYGEDVTDNAVKTSMPSPILDDLDFDIVFDYETELCGVHSISSFSPSSRDGDCDESNFSFIVSGNDDCFDSDSECDSEVTEEVEDCSWQSFKNQFQQFGLLFENKDLRQECSNEPQSHIEVNLGHESFEIFISSVEDDFDTFDPVNEHLIEINRKWNIAMKDIPEAPKIQKIQFAAEENLVQVRTISFTCEDERRSPWDQMHLDQCRFHKRIENVTPILSIILHKDHRDEVFKSRFADL